MLIDWPFRSVRFRVHPCFWLVVVPTVWSGYFLEVVTLFGLILIHELGHVSVARHFGWRMTEIELLPFGGVAKTDEWGTVPAKEEMLVAIAGPAFNGIVVVFGAGCYLFGWWDTEWAQFFVTANMWLAGFNLLPIIPLDGGRILQAFLSYRFPFRTCITSSHLISFTLSFGMLAVSVIPFAYGGPPLFNVGVIACFLMMSNAFMWYQKHYQFMRFLIQRQVDDVPKERPVFPLLVSHCDTVQSTIRRWKKEAYHVMVVRDDSGKVLRVLPEERLLDHFLATPSPRATIGDLLD